MAIGIILIVFYLHQYITVKDYNPLQALYIGTLFLFLPYIVSVRLKRMELSGPGASLKLDFSADSNDTPPKKTIPIEEEEEKRRYAESYAEEKNTQLPGKYASDFQLLDEKHSLAVIPVADPMTPMYMLDRNFRVIDWNIAFNLCFDRTLEGRRGLSILDWTYFLDNYEDVLSHGIEVFSENKILPHIDIEKIYYTSIRYGKIEGIKRAYQIPDDDGNYLGWLVTIDITFNETENAILYQENLFTALHKTLVWSEYSLCYDKVLNSTSIYQDLIQTLIGNRKPGPLPIHESSVILDIGAGTGNITYQLIHQSPQNFIVAIDNNPLMLNTLRLKCSSYMRNDRLGPGIVAIKQDAVSLLGLNNDFFDYVIINNVLYSMSEDDALTCLKEAFRVLKPGGEIRISEPQKSTDVNKVLEQIKLDLEKTGSYAKLEKDFIKLKHINETSLKPLLNRWSIDELERILLQEFNDITYRTDHIYADQSMLICARKGK